MPQDFSAAVRSLRSACRARRRGRQCRSSASWAPALSLRDLADQPPIMLKPFDQGPGLECGVRQRSEKRRVGTEVLVRGDLGGRLFITKQKKKTDNNRNIHKT